MSRWCALLYYIYLVVHRLWGIDLRALYDFASFPYASHQVGEFGDCLGGVTNNLRLSLWTEFDLRRGSIELRHSISSLDSLIRNFDWSAVLPLLGELSTLILRKERAVIS